MGDHRSMKDEPLGFEENSAKKQLLVVVAQIPPLDIHDIPNLEVFPIGQQVVKVHGIVERDVLVAHGAEKVKGIRKLRVRTGNVVLARAPAGPLPLVPQPVHVGVVHEEEGITRRRINVTDFADIAADAQVAAAVVALPVIVDGPLDAHVKLKVVARLQHPVDLRLVELAGRKRGCNVARQAARVVRGVLAGAHVDGEVAVDKGPVQHAAAALLAGDLARDVRPARGVDEGAVAAEARGGVEDGRGQEGVGRVCVEGPVCVALATVNQKHSGEELTPVWLGAIVAT